MPRPIIVLCGLLLLLLCKRLDPINPNSVIVWNVGQGQWVTEVKQNHCLHFDIGGEFINFRSVAQACRRKTNFIYISHNDSDHISFLRSLIFSFPKVHICSTPELSPLLRKTRLENLQISKVCPKVTQYRRYKTSETSSNDKSIVFWHQGWLFPGDGSKKYEKLWAKSSRNQGVNFMLAGHHGSKYSNSMALLNSLPHLQQFIVSARKRRYGHPHKDTLQRLGKSKPTTLKTEDWGNLYFEID